MQINNYKVEYNYLERFVIEKTQELCYNRSLDSYRVKYLNPKSSIIELYQLLNDLKTNKIKDFNTIISCSKEVLYLLKNDSYLNFGDLSKQNFENDINKIIKNSTVTESFEYEIYYLINNNKDYLNSLFDEINNIRSLTYDTIGEKISCFIKLDTLINYSISEALYLNFSKSYLYKLTQALFVYNETMSFNKSWQVFTNIVLTTNFEKYSIIFNIQGSESQLANINLSDLLTVVNSDIFAENTEAKINNFKKQKNGNRFVVIEVQALDYYQAMKLGKAEFAKVLDKIHIGHSNLSIKIRDTAIVVNSMNKEKANLQPIHYQIDGYYRSEEAQYGKFINDLKSIEDNTKIAYDAKDRINSALRQLRLGNEAIEIEKKFINYWIGLEFLFSNYNKDKSTFKRLLDYLPVIHSVYYIKRNLLHFHETVDKYNIDIEKARDLIYLTDVASYDKLINNYIGEYPLLSYRASRLKSHLLNNNEKRKKYLTKHKTHVDWHLIRLYRVRNELIHDAAMIENIENLTGNLRYYLNFTLNKLIEFFADSPQQKVMNDKLMTVDDFFMHHLMILDNLVENEIPLEEAIKVKYTLDLLR